MATNKKLNQDEELEKNKINGVDDATTNKAYNSSFTPSTQQQNAQNHSGNALSRIEDITSKNQIVSSGVKNTLNRVFTVPLAVQEADTYLNAQLKKIQSGKTSYTDQVKDMMAQIQGREKFSYDVDSDPLFQQALASAMSSGKQAMQDTIGQASVLTGGYGSTYATTAGNQAYNSFIEDAYDNLPQYYQMAMEAYQMEGDELYRQLGMLTDADDREYGRNVTAYDATYQHRNQMYNEAYQQFRDSKTDAYNMANLQLSEHGQLVSDAYNYSNASSDYANTMYNREYQSWADQVAQAQQMAEMLNKEWWNQTNFDESVRQYNENMIFNEDQAKKEWEYKYNTLAEEQRQYNNSLAEEQRQFNFGIGDTNNDGIVSDKEYEKYAERYGKMKSGDNGLSTTEITGIQKAYNSAGGGQKGYDAVTEYLKGIGKAVDATTIDVYIASATAEDGLPVWFQTWNIVKDTTNHLEGDDGNDVYRNLNGETMTFDELKKEINNSDLSDEEKESQLDALRKQGKK